MTLKRVRAPILVGLLAMATCLPVGPASAQGDVPTSPSPLASPAASPTAIATDATPARASPSSPASPTASAAPDATPAPANPLPSAAASTPPAVVPLDREVGASHWYQVAPGDDGRSSLYVGRLTAPTYRPVQAPSSVSVVIVPGSYSRAVLAWGREDGRTMVQEIWDEGSVLPKLRIRPAITALTTTPDARWIIWATARADGTMGGLWRRHLSRHASQRLERLAEGCDLRVSRLLVDDAGDTIVIAGSTADGATAVRALTLGDPEFRDVTVAEDGDVVGLLGGDLVVGGPAADGSAGPPFDLVDLATGATYAVGESDGSRAMIVPGPLLVWEGPDAEGRQSVLALAPDGLVPRTVWTGIEPWASASRHLATTTEAAGIDLAGWVALFPGALPFHPPDGSGRVASGLLVDLATGATSEVAAIAPPTVEGRPWRPILRTGDDRFASVEAVIAYRGGFLAVGMVGGARRWVTWWSPDGREWTVRPAPIPAGSEATPVRLAAHGRRVVLVASDGSSRDGPNHVRIWTSDDGRSWDAVPDDPRFGIGPTSDPEAASSLAHVRSVGRVGGRWAISGEFCIEGCYRSVLWTSADARHWTRITLPASSGRGRASGISDVVVGRDRFLGTRWVSVNRRIRERQAVASTDGRHWSTIGQWPGDDSPSIVDGPDGLTVISRRSDGARLSIWRSRDGQRWERVHLDSLRWGIDDIASSGRRIVVVGHAMVNPEGEDYATATLLSPDGRHWRRSLGWFMPTNVYPQAAAISGRAVVFLGQTQGRGFPLGWRTRLPG